MTEALIVGQPGDVVTWYPTTLVRCKCSDAPGAIKFNFVFLTGFDNWSSCGACGTLYANSHLVQDPTTKVPLMVVKHMAPTPQSEVM